MRHRRRLLQRQLPAPPRLGRWHHHFITRLVAVIASICTILAYIADATVQNTLGQYGSSVFQSLVSQIYMLVPLVWPYAIIAFLILIIICLTIGLIRLWRMYNRLESEMRQQNYIFQVDEHVLNQLPHLMHSEEEGESHES